MYIYIYLHKSQTWYPNNVPTMSQYDPRNWDQHSTLLRVKLVAGSFAHCHVDYHRMERRNRTQKSSGFYVGGRKSDQQTRLSQPIHNSSSKLMGIWICHIWAWIKIYGKNYKIPYKLIHIQSHLSRLPHFPRLTTLLQTQNQVGSVGGLTWFNHEVPCWMTRKKKIYW